MRSARWHGQASVDTGPKGRNKIPLGGIAMKTMPQKRAMVEVVRSSYKPTKAELEDDVRVNATPEIVAHAVTRTIKMKATENP